MAEGETAAVRVGEVMEEAEMEEAAMVAAAMVAVAMAAAAMAAVAMVSRTTNKPVFRRGSVCGRVRGAQLSRTLPSPRCS